MSERGQGGKETPIDVPSLMGRIAQAARYVVSSVKPTTWMGPNQPLAPAVPETAGRQFDYPVGINLQIQPRAYEPISFQQLRDLANGWDLLRLLIETRKDQMVKMRWTIKPIDPDQKVEGDTRIAEMQKLLRMPDGINPWQKWLRMVLEEMLVLDATTVYPRMTRGGGLFSLELMDGATIKRVIGDDGRTPLPPDPAYQQVLKGIAASDYTYDELIYVPRNTRVNKLYGYSPVEQIIMTVNIALRRQIHQLQYYTEGNLPDLLIGVPKEFTENQLERLARIWESRLNGNTATRRQAMFVPDGTKPYDIKEAALKDEMDEWLARVACFAFSVSPQPFIKMVNRGNQESMQEAALSEGLVPIMTWVKDLMDVVVWKYKGFLDLEFAWEEEEAQDPIDLANVQDIKIRNGSLSIDEARGDDGRPPLGMPNAVITASGPVLLQPYIDGEADGQPQAPQVVGPDGKPVDQGTPPKAKAGVKSPGAGEKPKAKDGGKKTVADAAGAAQRQAKLHVSRHGSSLEKFFYHIKTDRPIVRTGTKRLAKTVRTLLRKQAKVAAVELAAALGLSKTEEDAKVIIDAALAGLSLDWSASHYEVTKELEAVFADASTSAVQVMIGDDGVSNLITKLNANAEAWANRRAAELVGKKWVDGELVDNPNPKWAITESTRDMLRETVTQAYEEGWTPDQLGKVISDGYAFSDDRADMIADTELKRANNNGAMDGFRETGLELKKSWLLSDDHDIDDPCDDNAADGWIDLDDTFSSGDDTSPAHPRCDCSVAVMTVDASGNETESDEE